MDKIAAEIAKDDLTGAPSRDTVHRIIGQSELPPSQADVVATATVLARMAAWDQRDAVARVRELWIRAATDVPIGIPIEELEDPFALEVHRSIEVDVGQRHLPLLPCYVCRAHDKKLANVVKQACGGKSKVVTLVGGSSTGKTRACWEAIHQLSAGWRLWHPIFPDRAEAFLADLQRVRPRTVVWLNDAQLYLQTVNPNLGERVAAGLRELLRDAARGPVLVLATLWREYWEALTVSLPDKENPHPQANQLLTGSLIEVPESFTSQQLRAELAAAAVEDPRLAQAAKHTRDGQVTQYLAGVPVLIERYKAAPPAARALIDGAIDARRLGHGPELPYAMLKAAAPGYLTDEQWERADDDWLEQAFGYAARPCMGVRGPLTPIKPRPSPPRPCMPELCASFGPPPTQPDNRHYRLADYLDQVGRHQRADLPVPIELWEALAFHGNSDDLGLLALHAEERGLRRCAAQMRKNAIRAGNCLEAGTLLYRLIFVDKQVARQAAAWVAAAVRLDNPRSAAAVLEKVRVVGDTEAVASFVDRAAHQVPVDDGDDVSMLLGQLGEVGFQHVEGIGEVPLVGSPEETREAIGVLGDRAARRVPLDDARGIARLLMLLRWTGAQHAMNALVARDPARHVPVDKPDDVAFLLGELGNAGAGETVAVLADRAARQVPFDHVWGIADLLTVLQQTGDQEALATLLGRDPAGQVSLNKPLGIPRLLEALEETGATQAVATLVNRVAYQLPTDHPYEVAGALQALEKIDANEARAVLADRAAREARHESPKVTANLLRELQRANANEAMVALADDASRQAPLDDPDSVAALLYALQEVGAQQAVTVMADRVARNTHQLRLHDPLGVSALLRALRRAEAEDAVSAVLAHDPASQVSFDDPDRVAFLLETLREVDAQQAVTVMADGCSSFGVSRPVRHRACIVPA